MVTGPLGFVAGPVVEGPEAGGWRKGCCGADGAARTAVEAGLEPVEGDDAGAEGDEGGEEDADVGGDDGSGAAGVGVGWWGEGEGEEGSVG